jgi:hypothetical protein
MAGKGRNINVRTGEYWQAIFENGRVISLDEEHPDLPIRYARFASDLVIGKPDGSIVRAVKSYM